MRAKFNRQNWNLSYNWYFIDVEYPSEFRFSNQTFRRNFTPLFYEKLKIAKNYILTSKSCISAMKQLQRLLNIFWNFQKNTFEDWKISFSSPILCPIFVKKLPFSHVLRKFCAVKHVSALKLFTFSN